MDLNQEHIGFIIKDLHQRGIVLDEFDDEIVDHVCSAVENEMSKGLRFADAYHITLTRFGHDIGLRNVQHEIIQSQIKASPTMLRNHFKVALRHLSRQKFYSFINVSGLALGIAACLLIVLYVRHELSFDRHHQKADRIYRINGEIKFADTHYELAVAPAPLAQTLLNEYPEIESAVRFRSRGHYLVKRENAQERFREQRVIWADSTFFEIFSVPVLKGNPATALKEPNSIAISRTLAEKYFPASEPLGSTLILDDMTTTVAAVFEDMPQTGHFQFDILIAMSGLDEAQSTDFLSNNFNTYLLFKPGTDPRQFEAKLPAVVEKYLGPQAASVLGADFTMEKFVASGNKLEYTLIPLLTDIHLGSDLTAELGTNSDITYVYLFGAVAFFILCIACINFMNLSTARSANRSKEVGLRKVMGSLRYHLVRQFLAESILLCVFAFALAVGLAYLALPYFNSIARLDLTLPFDSVLFYALLFGCALIVGVMAGLYPSFFLSAFEPARVLKGQVSRGAKSGVIRGTLVVFQFAISIFLIIGTITVQKQLNYIQGKKIGFNKEQVIMVSDAYALGDQLESFKNEILRNSFVSDGTISGFIPVWGGWRNDNTFWPEGKDHTEETIVGMQNWRVDYNYLNTMGMKITEGRGFSRDFPSDSGAVVLNQSAVSHFHFSGDAIGKRIHTFGKNNPDGTVNTSSLETYTVIGVVEDFHFESLREHITPLGLFLGSSPGYASFRFEAGDTQNVIEAIRSAWSKMAPGQPFQYSFLDESFGRMYASEVRLGKIFAAFAILAIVIACLGLFALTAFIAEQRTKEIGIRKVLGASVGSIVVLLSREFGKWILIAFFFAAPLAWYAVNAWLEGYTYKVEVSAWVYVLAGLAAFLLAWLTMSFQSIKAASSNPVQALKEQ